MQNERGIAKRGLLMIAFLAVAASVLYRSPESASGLLPSPDATEYTLAARQWLAGKGLTVVIGDQAYPSRFAPGFSVLFLAPWLALGFESPGAGIMVVLFSALVGLWAGWRLCAVCLPGIAGPSAGFLFLSGLLMTGAFYRGSGQVMSDLTSLMVGLLAGLVFLRIQARPRPALFLVAGVLVAVGLSLRITNLALLLPFALVLFQHRLLDLRAGGGLLGPILATAAALAVYQLLTFGNAFTTGYHYWVEPRNMGLGAQHLVPNLREFSDPFFPAWQDMGVLNFLGPLSLLGVLVMGGMVRIWRRALWERTRPLLVFTALAAGPMVLFHLFYPFAYERFVLLFYALAWLLGAIWVVGLLPHRLAPWLALLVTAAVLILRPPDPDRTLVDRERWAVVRAVDQLVPDDAVVISHLEAMYAQLTLIEGTRRRYLPLDWTTDWFCWDTVGPPAGPKVVFFETNALDDPQRIRALLANGRQVFLHRPAILHEPARVDEFLSDFEVRSQWLSPTGDELMELSRPGGADFVLPALARDELAARSRMMRRDALGADAEGDAVAPVGRRPDDKVPDREADCT